MTGRVDKSFRKPILVTGELLVKLDEVLHENQHKLIPDLAKHYNIDSIRAVKYFDKRKVPQNIKDHHLYESLISKCSITYVVNWKNDLSCEFDHISNAVKELKREPAEPISIIAETGSFTTAYQRLRISSSGTEAANFVARGSLDKVRHLSDPIIGLLRNNSPEFSFLHNGYLKLFLVFSFLTLLTFTSFILVGYFAKFSNSSLGFSLFIIVLLIAISSGFWFAKIYEIVFPSVVFEFGSGQKHHARKKLVFAFCGILVTLGMAFAFS